MDSKTYAEIAGISQERVRQLARAGRLKADLVQGRWEIEYEGHVPRPPSRRPLSARSRAEMLRFFVTMKLDHVRGVQKARLARRYRELLAAPSKSALLLDWWGGDEPEGTFAERNFIRAAQLGDEDWLQRMLEYPNSWVLQDARISVARLTDRMLLNGMSIDDLTRAADLPRATVRTLVSKGEGFGLVPKLKVYRAADLGYSAVYAA